MLTGVVSENRSEVNRRSGMVADLRKAGVDPDEVVELGEQQGDCFDHVEMVIALEEAVHLEIARD